MEFFLLINEVPFKFADESEMRNRNEETLLWIRNKTLIDASFPSQTIITIAQLNYTATQTASLSNHRAESIAQKIHPFADHRILIKNRWNGPWCPWGIACGVRVFSRFTGGDFSEITHRSVIQPECAVPSGGS